MLQMGTLDSTDNLNWKIPVSLFTEFKDVLPFDCIVGIPPVYRIVNEKLK